MYNLKIMRYANGTSVRYFPNRFIIHEFPKRKSERVLTPFTDEDGNYEYATPYKSDEEIENARQESLRCSCSRSRKNIRNIALSVPDWKYFCTFTFSPEHCDRYSYEECSSLMKKFLRSLKIDGLKYIIVPELHADGAFHFHGLFSHHLPVTYAGKYKLSKTSKEKQDVYHIDGFTYGWNSATIVQSPVKCAYYITSYITKDLCAVSKNKRRYWYSYSTIKLNVPLKFIIRKEKFDDFMLFVKNNFYCSEVYHVKKASVEFYEFNSDSGLLCSEILDFFESIDCPVGTFHFSG